MEIRFTKKAGQVDSNEYQTVIEDVKDESGAVIAQNPVQRLVGIKVQQNDILLEDGTNTQLCPIGQSEVVLETSDDEKTKYIAVYQFGQLLRRYKFEKNIFYPSAESAESLITLLSSANYFNTNN